MRIAPSLAVNASRLAGDRTDPVARFEVAPGGEVGVHQPATPPPSTGKAAPVM